MGFEGFSGNESILYHLQTPCRVSELGSFTAIEREEWVPSAHVHRLARCDAMSSRRRPGPRTAAC